MGRCRKLKIRHWIHRQGERYANSWLGDGSVGYARQIHHSQTKKGSHI